MRGCLSLSARRAWIEIPTSGGYYPKSAVALRKESVDRNDAIRQGLWQLAIVALRKESVDRNLGIWTLKQIPLTSLSARRAWIEMRKITVTVDDVTRRSPQGERG